MFCRLMSSIHVQESLPYFAEKTPLGRCEWTRGSDNWMYLKNALPWAELQGAPLQELGSAVIFRAGCYEASKQIINEQELAKKLDGSNVYQMLSTLFIAYRSSRGWRVAFAPIQNTAEGVKVAIEGQELNAKGQELILPLEGLVGDMIAQAKKSRRIVLPLESTPLDLSTAPSKGGSEYAKNDHVIALHGGGSVGREIAEIHAGYLHDCNKPVGVVYELTMTNLDGILPKNDSLANTHAVIRRVGLGGVGYGNFNDVGAGGYFSGVGRARGEVHVVAQKISAKHGSKCSVRA